MLYIKVTEKNVILLIHEMSEKTVKKSENVILLIHWMGEKAEKLHCNGECDV